MRQGYRGRGQRCWLQNHVYEIHFQVIQRWHIPFLSFSHLIRQASAMCSTRTRHTSAFLFVGSSAPSHQLAVSTSPETVLAAVEAGGEPKGWAKWWVGIGCDGVEMDKLPGIRLGGCCRRWASFYYLISLYKLTLDGSRPITPGVQPIPVPNAKLTKFFMTVVFPELWGPMIITRGPPCSNPRFDSIRWRSIARWRFSSCGWTVDVDVYWDAGRFVTCILAGVGA